MRGVLLEVPESLPAERARLGLDVRDEMWDARLERANRCQQSIDVRPRQ